MDRQELIELGNSERNSRPRLRIRCCTAAGCLSANSQAVLDRLKHAVSAQELEDDVQVCGVGCLRLCCEGPLVQIDPQEALYHRVTPEHATSIVGSLTGAQATATQGDPNGPFFKLQTSVVLDNCGFVEPERIESYIAHHGYHALAQVLHEMEPAEVVDEITRSGLRGRGGAGYPTGVKWSMVAKQPADRKFIVCNADEGDPGAFMNRSVLESDPHKVLEGMAIAGYAVGASHGYIYVRGEYPLAIERLKIGIKQANKLGLLGSRICSSPFDFSIDIRIGAGAFVCGEETALIESIMGGRGTPTPRPPYPSERGLWGYPTLINNVETFANVPRIIRDGAEWFAGIGTEKSKGTKVFCLTGKVRNTGLVEVPLGTSLRHIVEDIGGGCPDGKVKAVQTGGPSGGCIPFELLDTPVDYESLTALGSIMGSGGMIVMDDKNDMVDVARFFMNFCMDESCGKCIPCRAGTVQLSRLLTRIIDGAATDADLARLESLCTMVKDTSLCGLGQTAPNPVLSTLRYFRQEYTSRIKPTTNGLADFGELSRVGAERQRAPSVNGAGGAADPRRQPPAT
jgi:bidirectional [NiFe] hydrogenase diaphorase subunit